MCPGECAEHPDATSLAASPSGCRRSSGGLPASSPPSDRLAAASCWPATMLLTLRASSSRCSRKEGLVDRASPRASVGAVVVLAVGAIVSRSRSEACPTIGMHDRSPSNSSSSACWGSRRSRSASSRSSCSTTCSGASAKPSMFELDADLPAELVPLSWLLGVWEGTGVIAYKHRRRGPRARVRPARRFTHDGLPHLQYTSYDAGCSTIDRRRARTPLCSRDRYWRLSRPLGDADPGPAMLPGVGDPRLHDRRGRRDAPQRARRLRPRGLARAARTGSASSTSARSKGPRIDLATDAVMRTRDREGVRRRDPPLRPRRRPPALGVGHRRPRPGPAHARLGDAGDVDDVD